MDKTLDVEKLVMSDLHSVINPRGNCKTSRSVWPKVCNEKQHKFVEVRKIS